MLRSVVNLTRADGDVFFGLLADTPLRIHVQTCALGEVNAALADVRSGGVQGRQC